MRSSEMGPKSLSAPSALSALLSFNGLGRTAVLGSVSALLSASGGRANVGGREADGPSLKLLSAPKSLVWLCFSPSLGEADGAGGEFRLLSEPSRSALGARKIRQIFRFRPFPPRENSIPTPARRRLAAARTPTASA
jgi:hypothetical protein